MGDAVFVSSKQRIVLPHDDIIKICSDFYQEDYVWEEKTKFFQAIGQRPIRGRTADKKIKDLNDLLTEVKTRDNNNDFQPT